MTVPAPTPDPADRGPAPAAGPLVALVAALLVAGAAIHAAAAGPHFDENRTHGWAFVAMAAAGALLAAGLVVRRARRGVLAVSIVFDVAVVGLWLWSRTWGLPGDAPEAVGFSDAVATALECTAVAVAVAALVAGRRSAPAGLAPATAHGAPAAAPVSAVAALAPGRGVALRWASLAAAVLGVSLLAGPAVAKADEHDHVHTDTAAGHDHDATTDGAAGATTTTLPSISGVFAAAPHDHTDKGTVHHVAADAGPCAPTPQQVAAADDLVARTTLALQKYRDVNVAVADGFRPLGFEPNGVHHYLNAKYRDDDAILDPTRPESILYATTATGDLYPAGVMFMMRTTAEHGPQIGGCLTNWHSHGFPFAKPGEQSVEMMHVWTIPLPGGPFAEHVEGQYARLYLGLDPIEDDGEALFAPPAKATGATGTTGAAAPSTTVDPKVLRGLAGLDGGGGVVGVLNALNVHGVELCAIAPVKAGLDANMAPAVVARLCDPVLNKPLPGAKSPPLTQVLAALASANAAKR